MLLLHWGLKLGPQFARQVLYQCSTSLTQVLLPFAHRRLWVNVVGGALWVLIFSRLQSVYWIPASARPNYYEGGGAAQ